MPSETPVSDSGLRIDKDPSEWSSNPSSLSLLVHREQYLGAREEQFVVKRLEQLLRRHALGNTYFIGWHCLSLLFCSLICVSKADACSLIYRLAAQGQISNLSLCERGPGPTKARQVVHLRISQSSTPCLSKGADGRAVRRRTCNDPIVEICDSPRRENEDQRRDNDPIALIEEPDPLRKVVALREVVVRMFLSGCEPRGNSGIRPCGLRVRRKP